MQCQWVQHNDPIGFQTPFQYDLRNLLQCLQIEIKRIILFFLIQVNMKCNKHNVDKTWINYIFSYLIRYIYIKTNDEFWLQKII